MSKKVYEFEGKFKWAFLNKKNKFDKYSMDVYVDEATRRGIKKTGTKCNPKEGAEGWYFTFTNKEQPEINIDMDEHLVGNGSTGKVKIMVEEFQSKEWGKIVRTTLKEISIINLIPYENEKVEQLELPI